MDSTVVTATAAAVGSLVGGAASALTTWMSQHTQVVQANAGWKAREREAVYKEFVVEASRVSVDALQHSLERPDQLVTLYGILGRIRIMSSDEILAKAEECCRRIVQMYWRPNMTPDQFRAALAADEFEPLKEFSAA